MRTPDDYIERLVNSEPEGERDVTERNAMGIPLVRAMAVGARFASSQDVEDHEAARLGAYEPPMPFWDGATGALEPLSPWEAAALEAVGITPEQWEIAVIEEHLDRRTK